MIRKKLRNSKSNILESLVVVATKGEKSTGMLSKMIVIKAIS